jgi:MATE family multidrug resistance protein
MLNSDLIDLDEETQSYCTILWTVITYAVPSILSIMFIFLYDNINIIFAGNLLSPDLVSAIGIGSLYINATGFFLALGLLGGMDTLCSQAYGAKHYKLLGTYANISRLCMFGFYILFSLPFLIINEEILVSIGQPEAISTHSPIYIRSMIPAVFFSMQFHVSIHYLQAMGKFSPGMVVTLITSLLHPFWCYFFTVLFEFDIKGIAYANGLTQLLNFCLISFYIEVYNPCPESNFYFNENSGDLKRIIDFLKFAVPSAITFMADWLGFHVLILYSSYIDLDTLTTNVDLYNFTTFLFTIPLGISMACCTLVGNSIGGLKVKLAAQYAIISLLVGFVLMFTITLTIWFYRDAFPYLYTHDARIASIFQSLLAFFVVFGSLDGVQIILNGILKGVGKQRPASYLVIMILYPINIPTALIFAFTLNYKIYGLWYSQLVAVVCLNISYLIMIICLDWKYNAIRTMQNINRVSNKLKNI